MGQLRTYDFVALVWLAIGGLYFSFHIYDGMSEVLSDTGTQFTFAAGRDARAALIS